MSTPVSLSPLLPHIDFSSTIAAVLAVAVVLVGVSVVFIAARHFIGIVRGKVYFAGQYWDKDVYQAALRDVKSKVRSGAVVDAESRNALRRFEYGHKKDHSKIPRF